MVRMMDLYRASGTSTANQSMESLYAQVRCRCWKHQHQWAHSYLLRPLELTAVSSSFSSSANNTLRIESSADFCAYDLTAQSIVVGCIDGFRSRHAPSQSLDHYCEPLSFPSRRPQRLYLFCDRGATISSAQ